VFAGVGFGFALDVHIDAVGCSVALFAGIEDEGLGCFAVAACAAGFLDEGLEITGEAVVDYEADVGDVDAHSEGGCCGY